MSVTVIGRHHDDVVFEDEGGPARIPADELDRLHRLADLSTNEHVTRLGRRFHRDTLGAVLRDLNNGDLPVLDTCSLCDEWAAFSLADPRPRCERHQETT